MSTNKNTGNIGERLACQFLRKKKYKIIERNVQLSNKELDIIAKIKEKNVFIEVKTHNKKAPGEAEDAMTSRKLHHLKKAISMYVNNKNLDPNSVRLDLICVDINSNTKSADIRHYIDIF